MESTISKVTEYMRTHTVDLQLDFRLVALLVYLAALLVCTKKGWVSFKELVGGLIVLLIASILWPYQITYALARAQYGPTQKALLMGFAPLTPLVAAIVCLLIYTIVKGKRLTAEQPTGGSNGVKAAARKASRARPKRRR